jgi:hypothetical protein
LRATSQYFAKKDFVQFPDRSHFVSARALQTAWPRRTGGTAFAKKDFVRRSRFSLSFSGCIPQTALPNRTKCGTFVS